MRLVVGTLAGVTIEGGPLVPRPFDRLAWRRSLVGDAPPRQIAASADGWPVELVDVGDDRFAIYAPLEFVGHIVARKVPPELRAAVDELLLSARVDLTSDDVIALAQLWE